MESSRVQGFRVAPGPQPYQDPEEPTSLGILNMNSVYKSLKKLFGVKVNPKPRRELRPAYRD